MRPSLSLDDAIKRQLGILGFLCHARSQRREACLPVFDLNIRIWWNLRKLRKLEEDDPS